MRNFITFSSTRSFGATVAAAIAIAGCSGGDSVLTPTGLHTPVPSGTTSSAVTPTPTPMSSPTSATTTASPTASPTGIIATASPTPSPAPTATASAASAITIVTSNEFGSTTLNFPQPGSAGACPASDYMQTITASETGYSGNFTAVSADTVEVTVAPASSSGMFTVTDTNSSTGNATMITISDTKNNSTQIPVTFNVVCLP